MAALFLDHPVPFGFAHQGGTDVAPGNTAAAFDHAVALGYRYIETDLHATSDGVLVVFHDDDMASTTGLTGPIESKTWEEVSKVLVGGSHPIPRFDDMVRRHPEIRFNVDPKNDSAVDPLIGILRVGDLAGRVAVGSFSDRRISRVRKALGPSACTSPGPLGLARIVVAALIWPRWRPPHAMVQVPRRYWRIPLVSPFLVGRYHRMGLQVHVWTINDEATMHELLDMGVDAIMTDAVGVLRQVLASRGAWPVSNHEQPTGADEQPAGADEQPGDDR